MNRKSFLADQVDECCKKLRELFETDRVKLEIIEALIKNGEKDEQKTSETFEALCKYSASLIKFFIIQNLMDFFDLSSRTEPN